MQKQRHLSAMYAERRPLKRKQLDDKPGFVPWFRRNKVSVIYLGALSPTHSIVLPSDVCSKTLGRAALMTPVYVNFQLPRCTARVSPHDWWALTPPSHPYLLLVCHWEPVGSQLFSLGTGGSFLLHVFALTNDFPLRSGMLYVARTFLVCHKSKSDGLPNCWW